VVSYQNKQGIFGRVFICDPKPCQFVMLTRGHIREAFNNNHHQCFETCKSRHLFPLHH